MMPRSKNSLWSEALKQDHLVIIPVTFGEISPSGLGEMPFEAIVDGRMMTRDIQWLLKILVPR